MGLSIDRLEIYVNLIKAIESSDIETVRKSLPMLKTTERQIIILSSSILLDLRSCDENIVGPLVDFTYSHVDDLGKKLIVAIIKENLSEIEALLKNGANFPDDDLDGFPSRYIFKRLDTGMSIKIIILLINYGYKPSLHHFHKYSVKKDDPDTLEIAKIILESGVIMNEQNYVEAFEFSELYWCLVNKNIDLVTKLLAIAAKDDRYNIMYTLFQAAVMLDRMDILKLIFSSGVDINSKYKCGKTMLHWACRLNEKIICFLLQNGADINAEDISQKTPLFELYWLDTRFEKCAIIVMKELAKLTFENFTVLSTRNMEFIQAKGVLKDHFERCKNELYGLSNTYFYGAHTYHSVMKMSNNNQKRLAKLMKNEEFVEMFEANLSSFPCYEDQLRRILKDAIQVKNESVVVESRLKSVFGDYLPDVVLRILADELLLKDLPLE